ncbi:glycosyltransferase [Puniceibacterium sediminis]|uniref:Glycosyltransferase involved in cell wall bisynthesis n=1 Tax=Puniceibacterium sediminis TaxID=1608407 RepID=A0A238ZQQ3_9RHOB|nr:glycosyltransferase [Puniceibacterium sediminis]SNR85371.1 Glycosyltransferase involved in cell wall bisynthesis [Puniceibacterium sediminis]
MHVVHILTRLLRAGSEENTIATCLWQVEHGHDVTLIHGPDPDPFWKDLYGDRIRFIEFPELIHKIRPFFEYRAIKAMKKLLAQIAPDVIHTHQSKAGIIGRLAASAVPRALVVHGIHIIPFDGVGRAKKAFYIATEKIAARHTDLFVAVSRSVGQAYVDEGICTHVEPVYSGMALDPFRAPSEPEDAADLLGIAPDAQTRPAVVLMLAAFEPRKRHCEFLRAWANVLPKMPPTRLLLAGKGPHEAAVHAEIRALGLEGAVVLCGFRSDPHALVAMADVCVLTSEREGLPRVVVQYITSGTPVVVADLPGIDEIVTHGVNGMVSDPNDMTDTAEKLRALIVDRAQLDRLADGARATDVSNWELDRLGARTTELYEEAIRTRAAAQRPVGTTT